MKIALVYTFHVPTNSYVLAGKWSYIEDGRTGHSIFNYSKKYLTLKDAHSIDPVQLPLFPGPINTPENFLVFNGLRDSSPDAWGRYLMEKIYKHQLSEFDFITLACEHRSGALSYEIENPSFEIKKSGASFSLEEAQEYAEKIIDNDQTIDEQLARLAITGTSLGGARPKSQIFIDGNLYLAKYHRKDDISCYVAAEHAALMMAKDCGITIPDTQLKILNGRPILLSKRFDRLQNQPIHFISGLTILGAHETDYGNNAHSYSDLANALKKFGKATNIENDIKEIWKRMVFNILVHNNDDHLRNFGFLWNNNGYIISPAYDIVPNPVSYTNRKLQLVIGKNGRSADIENALSSSQLFNISSVEAQKTITEMQKITTQWEIYFKASFKKTNFDYKYFERAFIL